jgi:hypothetical protein
MRLARRALLLVAFTLLASPATAHVRGTAKRLRCDHGALLPRWLRSLLCEPH